MMIKPHLKSREGKPSQSQTPLLTHPTSQISLHKDPYQLQNDNGIMTRTNMTNQEEDHFNDLLLTLLNGQQDLQKQSFNMGQDMTCRYEYDKLMIGMPIYNRKKYGTSRLAATD